MTEILFARKIDVDALNAAIAGTVTTLSSAKFVTTQPEAGLGAEQVLTDTANISWDFATPGQAKANLVTVNANVGTFGTASNVGQFTVTNKGQITAAANVPIAITSAAVTDFNEAAQDAVGNILTDSAIIDFTYNDGANTITATVINNSIGDAQLRQGIARSVIGVTGNGTANVADIQGTTDQVLRVDTAGTALTFGTVATGGVTNNAITFAKFQQITTDRLVGRDTAATGNVEEVSVSGGLEFTGGPGIQRSALSGAVVASAGSNTTTSTVDLVTVIGDGVNTVTTGVKGFLPIDFACTIVSWTLVADASGSIVIDVWKDTYANFPPTVADTIAGSEKPTLSSVQKNQDLSLSTWTTSVSAGDVLGFNVDSATTVKQVTLAIKVTKTS